MADVTALEDRVLDAFPPHELAEARLAQRDLHRRDRPERRPCGDVRGHVRDPPRRGRERDLGTEGTPPPRPDSLDDEQNGHRPRRPEGPPRVPRPRHGGRRAAEARPPTGTPPA